MPLLASLGKFESGIWKRFLAVAGATLLTVAGLSAGCATAHAQTYTDLHDFSIAEGFNPQQPGVLAQGRDGNLYGTVNYGGTGACGMVFKMTPSGTLTPIYNFDGNGKFGCDPWSGLTLGTDGNFYGSTYLGGAHSLGTLFKITPAGVLTVLHEFDGTQNDSSPIAPPVQGKSGAFYGVTSVGAAYSITSAGKYKVLNPFIYAVPNVEVPLLLANDGNFYGVTVGSVNDKGTVFRMSASGAVKILYHFDGTHGNTPRGQLAQGADGLLYGATQGGGAHAFGVAFKMTLKGSISVLHDFQYPPEGAGQVAGFVSGSDGKFYSASSGGGAVAGTLYQITKTGAFATLYNFDNTHGATPYANPMQHTNGTIYGLANAGGANGKGVAYSLSNSLPRFVALMTTSGTAGQTVQILGTGLTGTTSVKFGSGSATFNVVSDSYMTATVPANGTSGNVTVVTPAGTLTSNKAYKIAPVITGFSPPSGPVGSLVTITGSGFIGTTQVKFGGVKATSYTVDPSGASITATVPVGAKTGKIAIKTSGGNASSKTTFTVT
ncbi:MAG: IPT/TIG domain-containing protein [Acidobacteria bacterium]|nr:IPT/TIG domain-containing protein [Acidobacteriota bacterium]